MVGNEPLVAKVDQNGIGKRPGADLSGIQPESLGAVSRRPPEHLCGLDLFRAAGNLRKERGHLHLLDHGQVVVRAGAIRAQRHPASGALKLVAPEGAGGKLHVGHRIVRNHNAPLGKNCDVFIRHMHNVRGDRIPVQNPEAVQILHRAHAVLPHAVVKFLAGFRQMG